MTNLEKKRKEFIKEIQKPLDVKNDNEEKIEYSELDNLMNEVFSLVEDINDQ